MKTEARNAWVAALRSGEYEQTKHVLQDHYGYCCLGVACDVFADTLDIEVNKVLFREGEGFEVYYDFQAQVLPQKIADHVGLISVEGAFTELRMEDAQMGDTLTSLNDAGATFSQIADILEEHEDLLFTEKKSYG